MADAYGGVANNWRCHLQYQIVQQNDGQALVRSTVYFQAVNNWEYHGLNGNFGATVAGQTASSSTTGGINVGPGGQQNIAAKEVWITKGRTAQNVSCSGYINISGFAAGSSSASGTIWVAAKPSHTVSYNANGGTGAPGNQTKWHGEVLTLSSTKPTRTNYEFQGWAKSANGSVEYQPGSLYGLDQNITFYAIWKQSFVPPTISDVSVNRSDSTGAVSNQGTYVKVNFNWSTSTTNDSSNVGQKIIVTVTPSNGSGKSYETIVNSKSGTFSKLYSGLSEDTTYSVKIEVIDKHLTTSYNAIVPKSTYILDLRSNGRGLGIGTTSSSDDQLDVGWKTDFAEGVSLNKPLEFVRDSCKIRRIYAGSKVFIPKSTRVNLVNSSTISAHGGHRNGDICIAINGDYNANKINVVSVDYTNDGYHVQLEPTSGANINANMRIDWMVISFGDD